MLGGDFSKHSNLYQVKDYIKKNKLEGVTAEELKSRLLPQKPNPNTLKKTT
jgi:hypothetical protein